MARPVNTTYEFTTPDGVLVGRMTPKGVVLIEEGHETPLGPWQLALEKFGVEINGDFAYGDKEQVEAIGEALGGTAKAVKEAKPAAKKAAKPKAEVSEPEEETEEELDTTATMIELDPEDVIAGKNPRGDVNPLKAERMAEQFRKVGQLQNVVVGPADKKGRHRLMAGFTRHQAALLNKANYPNRPQCWMLKAIVRDEDHPQLIGTIENIIRDDMNAVAIARVFLQCIEEQGMNQRQIAKMTGRSTAEVSNTLSLLELPKDIQRQIEEGTLTETQGLRLSKMSKEHLKIAVGEIKEQLANPEEKKSRGQKSAVDMSKVEAKIREAKKPVKADSAGDDEEEEVQHDPKFSRKEIMLYLEEGMSPTANPVRFEISETLFKLFNGKIGLGTANRKFTEFVRADGKVVDTASRAAKA